MNLSASIIRGYFQLNTHLNHFAMLFDDLIITQMVLLASKTNLKSRFQLLPGYWNRKKFIITTTSHVIIICHHHCALDKCLHLSSTSTRISPSQKSQMKMKMPFLTMTTLSTRLWSVITATTIITSQTILPLSMTTIVQLSPLIPNSSPFFNITTSNHYICR